MTLIAKSLVTGREIEVSGLSSEAEVIASPMHSAAFAATRRGIVAHFRGWTYGSKAVK